ncbi:hypothetical protein [Nocardioides euryhalodurans]|uniref:Uncharacterized protein n=1 Tax=Nocardioides euryhalodurans TaxID=2518370 RepID=A0A4P7GMA9_9ACTN|nr:hypothetical protein [Nocardioides euryhalodurans]QBR92907.1 hypothetical protein EXE57_11970 [Nocardioides euryhalodurans]
MEDELTPAQAERVRRLLADARHTDPVPDEVAARLDRVLAGLGEESPREDVVLQLADRRRKGGRLLLAAAAVVVAGVGIAQVVDTGGSDEASTAGDAGADESLTAPDRASGGEEREEPAAGQAGPGAVAQSQRSVSGQEPQRIRPEQFVRDAQRARAGARSSYSAEVRGDAQLDALGCEPGAWGGGRYVAITYDGNGGWLVFRAPRGDTQVVDLFLCDEDDAERSATLRFR